MPRQFNAYEPDSIDCAALVTALGEDFGVIGRVETRYELDLVVAIARCHLLGSTEPNDIIVQAKVTRPLRSSASLFVAHYSALLDCWHQLDRGVLAASARPIERGWNGRPRTPRRRT